MNTTPEMTHVRGSWIALAKLSLRNLRRNRRRNLATAMAIAGGFAAFLLAAGYAYRVQKVLSRYTIYALRTGHVAIYKKGGLDMYSIKPKAWSLTLEHQKIIDETLKRTPHLEFYGRVLLGQGLIGNGCKTFPFMGSGVEPDIENKAINHPELLQWAPHLTGKRGRGIWDFPEDTGPIAVSIGLAKLLGKSRVHDEIPPNIPLSVTDCLSPNAHEHFADDANVQLAAGTWDGMLNALDGEMVQEFSTGLNETNNSSITTTLTKLQRLYDTDHVTFYSIWLNDTQYLGETVDLLTKEFAKSAPDLEILPWQDERISPYYTGTMRFIFTMVSFVGIVLAAVVALSIFNSATMTVIERSQEVGMMRSMGYTRSLIRRIFVIEGLILTLISTLFGGIIGGVVMVVINNMEIKFSPPGISGGITLMLIPNLAIALGGAVLISLLAVASTWFAVAGISRKNIAGLVAGAHS